MGADAAPTDEALLAAVALGDPQAFAVLFDRHAPRVLGLARIMLGDDTAAQDILQDTFLRVWRYAGSVDPRRGSATSWLLTIARNLCVDTARTQDRVAAVDPRVLIEVVGREGGPSPEDRAAAADDLARLRTAVRALPPAQRRALLLARWHGRSAAEIAAAEGVPLETIRSRLRLALAHLQASMDPTAASPAAGPPAAHRYAPAARIREPQP